MKMNFVNMYRIYEYGKMGKRLTQSGSMFKEQNKKKNTLINLNNIIDCLGDSGRNATK